MDFKMSEEELKEFFLKKFGEECDVTIDAIDLTNWAEDAFDEILEEKLDKSFNATGTSLDDFVGKSVEANIFKWIESNLDEEEVIDILKDAVVNKLKDLSLDKLKELLKPV